MEQKLHTKPDKEKKTFKPYVNATMNLGKEIYERLVEAISRMEPQDRPWCGIGVTVDVVAVAPKGVTIAVVKELSNGEKNVVYVPRNWREPWERESVNGEKHVIEGNPCEQGERAIAAIRRSIVSSVKTNDRPVFPSIKCLILFPDGYEFEGPKEFSLLDGEEVVTLSLRNLRDLPEAILMATGQERLDSQIYRKWIQSSVLSSSDDSILGTWLDPAFDEAPTEPPKAPLWRLSRLHHQAPPVENEFSSQNGMLQAQSGQTRRTLRMSVTIIAGIMIGMVGWGLYVYDVIKPMPQSLSLGRSVVSPRPETPARNELIEVPVPQTVSLLPEDETEEAPPIPEPEKSDELQEPTLPEDNQLVESEKKLLVESATSNELQSEQQKMERLLRDAILLRAIQGVTVKFVDDTAYLEGQVATENQKSAAEKAARSVAGIKEVRNSIEVLH